MKKIFILSFSLLVGFMSTTTSFADNGLLGMAGQMLGEKTKEVGTAPEKAPATPQGGYMEQQGRTLGGKVGTHGGAVAGGYLGATGSAMGSQVGNTAGKAAGGYVGRKGGEMMSGESKPEEKSSSGLKSLIGF